jgi:hypothetical protein
MQRRTVLHQSAETETPPAETPGVNATSVDTPSVTASAPAPKKQPDDTQRKLDMPWNELQAWALRDNLSKYTVQVVVPTENGKDTMRVYTLWRTLSNEVTALSGYPLQFLVDRYQEIRDEFGIQTSTDILPYIDGYTFEADGGLTGCVYGVAGVAQGTQIQTTPVAQVQTTLPKGYVLTQEGIVYELGLPTSSTGDSSFDGRSKMVDRAAASLQSAVADSTKLTEAVVQDGELVRLGALTAVIIGGAWAVESLSHHLTVNVFWV